ncbi:MAG: TIR domain-containing protein [Rubrivivax sp.]|nr:TIR domain-containing protein [Rubrivivax sp.]
MAVLLDRAPAWSGRIRGMTGRLDILLGLRLEAAGLEAGANGRRVLDLAAQGLGDEDIVRLAASPVLRWVNELHLVGNRIGAVGAKALAMSRFVDGLTSLDLSGNPIGDAGVQALASSPLLRGLRGLALRHCGVGTAGVAALLEPTSWVRDLQRLDVRGRALRMDVWAAVHERGWVVSAEADAATWSASIPAGAGSTLLQVAATHAQPGGEPVATFGFSAAQLLQRLADVAVAQPAGARQWVRAFNQVCAAARPSGGAAAPLGEATALARSLLIHGIAPSTAHCPQCAAEHRGGMLRRREWFGAGEGVEVHCPQGHLLFEWGHVPTRAWGVLDSVASKRLYRDADLSVIAFLGDPADLPSRPAEAGGREVNAEYSGRDVNANYRVDPTPSTSVKMGLGLPRRLARGAQSTARVVVYAEAFRAAALSKLEALGEAGERRLQDLEPDHQGPWALGAPVVVRVHSDVLECTPPHRTFEWSGRDHLVTFAMQAPPGAAAGRNTTVHLEVLVGEITMLDLAASVLVEDGPLAQWGAVEAMHITTGATPASAFASYASADADEVAGRLSTLSRWLPQLRIFQDCLDLRPNEAFKPQLAEAIARTDRFLLFWSRHAAASPWVQWELDTAVTSKGVDHVVPMPLEDPELAPPPSHWQHEHMRDRYLLVRHAMRDVRRADG